MVVQHLFGKRKAPGAASATRMRLFWLGVVFLVFMLTGCSGYKFIRTQELEVLAEGIEWYVERAKPREDLEGAEKAKFERVGHKLSRNARALAE